MVLLCGLRSLVAVLEGLVCGDDFNVFFESLGRLECFERVYESLGIRLEIMSNNYFWRKPITDTHKKADVVTGQGRFEPRRFGCYHSLIVSDRQALKRQCVLGSPHAIIHRISMTVESSKMVQSFSMVHCYSRPRLVEFVRTLHPS